MELAYKKRGDTNLLFFIFRSWKGYC